VRKAVRLSLHSHGYTILDAATGEEALKLAVAERPDLILSDVNMTGMDGFALLKCLRAGPETATIPVILMTGVPEQATVRYSMEHGADDYLAKPFNSEALVAAVKARLERQQILQADAKANEARLLELLSCQSQSRSWRMLRAQERPPTFRSLLAILRSASAPRPSWRKHTKNWLRLPAEPVWQKLQPASSTT
jgi:DNA-binding response OmpR family regulator